MVGHRYWESKQLGICFVMHRPGPNSNEPGVLWSYIEFDLNLFIYIYFSILVHMKLSCLSNYFKINPEQQPPKLILKKRIEI